MFQSCKFSQFFDHILTGFFLNQTSCHLSQYLAQKKGLTQQFQRDQKKKAFRSLVLERILNKSPVRLKRFFFKDFLKQQLSSCFFLQKSFPSKNKCFFTNFLSKSKI